MVIEYMFYYHFLISSGLIPRLLCRSKLCKHYEILFAGANTALLCGVEVYLKKYIVIFKYRNRIKK